MKKRKVLPGINMTPMIDVVFQMIIFFICTSELEKNFDTKMVTLEWAPRWPAGGGAAPARP